MERRHINPSGIHKHPAFTRVITVKGPAKMVFVAGQTPSDEAYRPVAVGDYRGQYLKVLESLTAQLEAAGASWDDVVYQRIFVLDVDKYLAVARDPAIPKPWRNGPPPGSTLIGVTRLSHPDFLIEIDLIAMTSDG
jgi:enamine deaminase RidA (YjgF/YER057c/UK114 family)